MGSRKYVLIVDDCPPLAHCCAAVLREHGYSVGIALSATGAVASLGDARPELVVLNTRMRGGQAYRVMAVLRLTDGASIPVLALAGPGAERARWGAAPIGMEFLSPMAKPEEMAAAVERLIGPALPTPGCRCALCDGVSRESALTFVHLRKGERASLEMPLCETCGNRLEKHLKRAIPKRLMRLTPVHYGGKIRRPPRVLQPMAARG